METINYCDKCGNCSRCGNCCAAMIPLTREEEETIRKYIHENKIEPEYFQDEKNINLQCCFYDRKNKKCKIYDVRPNICRSFKCNRPISDLNKERDYVTVIIPINEYFDKEKLSLRDRIINALNASPMTKTELYRYLGYARVVNSVSHQLAKLIIDNQVIEINKKYHLK